MSDSKKPTVSEIRAWSEMLATRQWDTQRISYLLDLVERMGKALSLVDAWLDDQPDGRGQVESRIVKEARALLEELKQ